MDYFQVQSYSHTGDYTGPVFIRSSPPCMSTEAPSRRFHPYITKRGSDRNQARTSAKNGQNYYMGSSIKEVCGVKEMYNTNSDLTKDQDFYGYGNAKGLVAEDTCQNADTGVLLSKAYQDYLQTYGYPDYHQQLYSLSCLNDISGTGSTTTNTAGIYMYPQPYMNTVPVVSDVTTSTRASLSPELDHPFYWRRRAAPADGMTRTRDKYRVVYTEKQRIGLEKEYGDNKFITAQRKAKLSKELDLSERQIKIWFQNRRAKERRDMSRKETSGKSDSSASSPNNSNSAASVTSVSPPVQQDRSGNDITNMTSCRFADTEAVTSSPISYSTGQCRYQSVSPSNCGGHGNQHIPPKNCDNYGNQFVSTRNIDEFDRKTVFSSDNGKHDPGAMFDIKDTRATTSGMPISPSGWSGSPSNSFVPFLNVSPLTVNQDFGFGPRL